MTADYVELEARVAELERQGRHVLPAKIDAMNYAISLIHEDTRAIRQTQEAMAETLEAVREKQGTMEERQEAMRETQEAMREKQGEHGTMMEEILRRLPAEPGA